MRQNQYYLVQQKLRLNLNTKRAMSSIVKAVELVVGHPELVSGSDTISKTLSFS